MGELRLEVREFQSLARWRWVLTRPGGTLVADVGCWIAAVVHGPDDAGAGSLLAA